MVNLDHLFVLIVVTAGYQLDSGEGYPCSVYDACDWMSDLYRYHAKV